MTDHGPGPERQPEDDPIRAEIEIDAPADACYRAFADPDAVARWFVDRAAGEARVGETVTWSFTEFDYHIPYEVLEADPGERFALALRIPGMPEGRLEVTFEPGSSAATRVRLVNHGFHRKDGWDEEYEGVVSGWSLALATLRHQLERFPDRDRRSFLAMSPMRGAFRDLAPSFRTRDGLAAWLTAPNGGELGPVGSRFELRVLDGPTLAGQVLAHTQWESLISWEDADAVLGFKAFGGPMGRVVGIHGTGWGWSEDDVRRYRAPFDAALARLTESRQDL